jgi:hypothetical protein
MHNVYRLELQQEQHHAWVEDFVEHRCSFEPSMDLYLDRIRVYFPS